jgi:hypothetical protein
VGSNTFKQEQNWIITGQKNAEVKILLSGAVILTPTYCVVAFDLMVN